MSLIAIAAVSRSTTWISNDDGSVKTVLAFVLGPSVEVDRASKTWAVCGDGRWMEVGTKPGQGKVIT